MKKVYKSVLFVMMANAAMAQSQFFTPTKYRGAFAPAPTTQWTDGWTNWDPQNTDYNPTNKEVVTISGNITANTTWSSSKIYKLVGTVYVKNNAVLTIGAGTVIQGDAAGACLVITRGAKIYANGTKTSPIVFTSDKAPGTRAAGDWGGVILLGKSTNNRSGGVGNIEGLTINSDSEHGGSNDADNSGSLKFVRIEYSGYPLQPNQEINGLTMGSVGSGTIIENIQVSYNQDDSFEWFGGTVNAKNLVSYRCLDDDFDTDHGYRGNVQFGLALRDPNLADVSQSSSFESDNDKDGTDATPFTAPIFSNMTVVGPLRGDVAASVNANHKRNGRLRRNSSIKILNSVLMDAKTAIFIDGAKAEAKFQSGAIVVAGNVIAGYPTNKLSDVATNRTAVLTTLGANNDTVPLSTAGILTTPYNFTAPDYRPATGSIALTGSQFTHSSITSLVKTLPATQLKITSRNVTLPSLSSTVYADIVSGANGYRFRITDVNTGAEEIYDNTVYTFAFFRLLSNKKFNTTYSVAVAPIYGTIVQNYGTAYNVTTPSANTTIKSAVCESTLSKFDDLVAANAVVGATKYYFIVDNGAGLKDSLSTTASSFRFTSFFSKNPALAIYGQTYNVRVKVEADGVWTTASSACPVTLPALPAAGFLNAGQTMTSILTRVNIGRVYGASAYRVFLYNTSDEQIGVATRSANYNYLTFDNFTATKGAGKNGTYKMAVQYQFNGEWSALSEKATFIKNYASFITENTTTTVAFPNPFNTTFAIGLDRESNEAVQVSITDLTGKVVESTTVEAANVSRITLGEELTPGIYTVTVKQGAFVENIKAIKTEK
jgi:hypothetical protein